MGTGKAEPFGLGGVAKCGLHRGEGDQFGIAQAGRNAGLRADLAEEIVAPSRARVTRRMPCRDSVDCVDLLALQA